MTNNEILTQMFHSLEEISENARRLSGLIMVFQLAVDQDASQKTANGFEIVVEKGFDLSKQCESLFNSYLEHSSQLRNSD
ncbi:MAG: hypothetical protein K2F81_01600 [Ruminococcus sp.]|nr:hypothetical protein [Ruminococcus sp.]